MMKRTIFGALAVTVAVLLFAGDLWAHGGQFRGPGGAVPPNMREPTDPTPPPPPPPSGPPTTPSTPTTPGSPNSNPTPTSVGPTTTPTQPTSGNQPRKGPSAITFENWSFWYHNNKETIETLKDILYSVVSSESLIFDLGGRERSNRSDAMHNIRAAVESTIIPAMEKLINDPKLAGHQDTESAAYIALAKMTNKDPKHIEMLMKGLDPKEKKDLITQESAALALGLLRRQEEQYQFAAADLDKVRTFLFDVFENDKDYQARTRGFAALSLGLLGDQPTGSADYPGSATDEGSAAKGAAAATTARLFELLKADYSNQDLYVGLMMAIGLQPKDSLTEDQRAVLREVVLKGKMYKGDASNLVRSYAALTIGRIGNTADIPVLQRALTARRNNDPNIQRSAAIGLGVLSRLIPAAERVNLANGLLEAIQKNKVKDSSARNFSYISLAYVVINDVKQDKTDVIDGSRVEEFLLKEAEDGKYMHRPFAALALSLMGREITAEPNINAYGEVRQKALEILRNGVQSKKMDKRGRAAFACALGIIKDEHSQRVLREIVADRKEDQELRGYSALALGLVGHGPKPVLVAIREALKEKRSEEMRQQCATALGLLKDDKAVELLLEELRNASSQSVKGQVVLALAKIGNEEAVGPLVEIALNEGKKKEQDLTRALATAGLGVIGDLESIPSLARISKDVNYRASTDLINEVLSII